MTRRTITIADTPDTRGLNGWRDTELENRLFEWAEAHGLLDVTITITNSPVSS